MPNFNTAKNYVRKMFGHVAGHVDLAGAGAGGTQFLGGLFAASQSLSGFFNSLFKAAIIIGAMLAVLRLGYAGFVYLTTDVMSSKQTARSIISNAVLGLLLLLAVWLILAQINPQILNLNILQSVTPANTQAPSPAGQNQPAASQLSPEDFTSQFRGGFDNPQ